MVLIEPHHLLEPTIGLERFRPLAGIMVLINLDNRISF